jgi:hypothetical protein
MKDRLFIAVFALCCAPLPAQAPVAAPVTHSSEIGFSYSLPADWEVVAVKPGLSPEKKPTNDSACAQIALTARRGDPASVVVVVVLPFDCFGRRMTDKDLPGFAAGASEQLKQSFNLVDPRRGEYSLGAHGFWIERAKGTLLVHTEVNYTVETVCGILKRGAACWMILAADDAALLAFEHGAITLDGESAAALVPADAFAKPPPIAIR